MHTSIENCGIAFRLPFPPVAVCTGCLGNCISRDQDCLCCHWELGRDFRGGLAGGPTGGTPAWLCLAAASPFQGAGVYVLLSPSGHQERGKGQDDGSWGVETEPGLLKAGLRYLRWRDCPTKGRDASLGKLDWELSCG